MQSVCAIALTTGYALVPCYRVDPYGDTLRHLRCLDLRILPCIALVLVTTSPDRSMHSFSFASGNKPPENFKDRGDCIAYLRRTILSPSFSSSFSFPHHIFPVSFPCTLITNEIAQVGAGRRSVTFMHTHVVYTPGSSTQISPRSSFPHLSRANNSFGVMSERHTRRLSLP